ncbi:sensor histidine kinase [Larkinella ripae]
MKTSTIPLLHLGYWLVYCLVVSVLFILSAESLSAALEDWDDGLIILAIALLIGLISFYAFYSWLVPRYLTSRKIRQFVRWGLVVNIATTGGMVALTTVAISVLLSVVFENVFLITFSGKDLQILLIGFSLISVINGMLGTTIRGFITWYTDIHVREVLVNKTLHTELALLKAQLNPHFLFNTLNNIDILIEHDAPRASLYLNKLSDLLRFVLYETQADQIPLTLELDYIKKYIALQKIRTTNAEYVTLQIHGEPNGLLIAPMLFVPYIENAFKHATNKKKSDAIRISLVIDEKFIHFQCVNQFDENRSSVETHRGLGNKLLRQRLTLLYQEKYRLTIQAVENEYRVNLELPVITHELSAH